MIAMQFTQEPRSTKTLIAEALVRIIEGMGEFKYVQFDKVRLYTQDFTEFDIPAAQFIAVAENLRHVMNDVERTWSVTLEIINKSNENRVISQKDMWNIEYRVARAIFKDPTLGVKGVINATYVSNSNDLHLLEPYYVTRMDFDIVYKEPLIREC